MATFNGIKDTPLIESMKNKVGKDFTKSPLTMQRQNLAKESVKDLILNDKKTFTNFLVMIVVWISSSFGYYLISYQVKYLPGNLYLNGIILAIAEMSAYGLSGFVYKILGLKTTFLASYVLAIIGMFCIIFATTTNKYIIAIFILGCRFGVS